MLSKLTRKLVPAFLVSLVGSLPVSVSVWAAPGDPNANKDVPNLGGGLESFYMILKVIGVLIFIIGIFFVLVRLLARKNQSAAFGRPVRSIGGVPLGQNKSLQIVSIGKALYIVGVGENIQLLDKIDDEETVAELTELLSGGGGPAMPEFMTMGNWLRRLRERLKPVEEEELAASSFGYVLQEKLQQIASSKKRTQELLQQQDEERFDPK